MKQKRSLSVPLILLGTMTISGCDVQPYQESEDVQVSQSYYTTKEECEADWAEDKTLCKEEPVVKDNTTIASNDSEAAGSGSGHAGGGGGNLLFLNTGGSSGGVNSAAQAPSVASRWAGPRYYWDRGIDKPVVVHDSGRLQVMNNASSTLASRNAVNSSISKTTSTSHSTARVSRGGFSGSHFSSGG